MSRYTGRRSPDRRELSLRTARAGDARAGVTLVEMLIALTVFGLIMAGALGFMNAQNRAFHGGLDRMTALQTARFALQSLEVDLATAGSNVPGEQPALGYAGSDVVAFHADYATRTPNDPFAVFYDPDAPPSHVVASTSTVVIPTTSYTFPDTTYLSGGATSPAELLIFYFEPDTSTARGDDYALYRQVNAAAPELVARRILKPDSLPFFRYFTEGDTLVDSIPDAQLPVGHDVPMHLSSADTGAAARIDDVRAVRVTVKATNGRTDAEEETVELTRIVTMPNVDLGVVEACGSAPMLGSALVASLGVTGSGDPAVDLSWNAATDESGGEGDVVRYVVWRQELPATGWEDPYLSIPAGATSYSYSDAAVEPGKSYRYGLAAQDCTPSLSPITSSVTVNVP